MVDLGFIAVAVAYGLVVVVHEFGHYGVGRWLAGIPASEIAVVLLAFPQHVALRDGEEWVGPFQPRYGELYAAYNTNRAQTTHVDLYTAGGLIGQALGVAVIVGLCLTAGQRWAAELVFEVSVLLSASYLIIDALSFLRSSGRGYTGDFSALWRYSPVGAAVVCSSFAVVHGGLYLLL